MSKNWGKIVTIMRTSCSLPMDVIRRPVYFFVASTRLRVNKWGLSPVTYPSYSPSSPQHFLQNQSVKMHFFTVSTMPTISTTNLNLFER